MNQAALDLLRNRVSVERFDATRTIDDATVRDLIADAVEAPSSFNLQHWRFIAVRDPADREALCKIAYNQRQVADASVTFIILADPEAPQLARRSLQPAVDSGALPEGKAEAWIKMSQQFYAEPGAARDEAMRSGGLVAMQLMLAAEARGLCSGALSGFDPKRLREHFDIPDRYIPVMLLAVGWAADTDEPRKTRLPVDDVLAFDRCRHFLEE